MIKVRKMAKITMLAAVILPLLYLLVHAQACGSNVGRKPADDAERDTVLNNLLGGLTNITRQGGSVTLSDPLTLTGGRSPASIQRVATQNAPALRHAYNRRLQERPELSGRIDVKFSIDESGKVISAQAAESTMNDPELENFVIERVKGWNFEPIDKPGDVTEVTYPFVFSQ
ncbi:MAG: TonB family protein [Chitinispirillales bacterium]|nr:TonB family protein [Chitinispirillales bacterium]